MSGCAESARRKWVFPELSNPPMKIGDCTGFTRGCSGFDILDDHLRSGLAPEGLRIVLLEVFDPQPGDHPDQIARPVPEDVGKPFQEREPDGFHFIAKLAQAGARYA